ncbi:MAG TPA: hypothetical protein VKA69_11085, partial [Desulfobacteria bacterium]|nr:hypothetical protein [Desulfobacteria bacterium]
MKFLKIIFMVSALISLQSCAMLDATSKKLATQEESTAPRVYYAGVVDLKMFSQSRVAGSPIASLPLYEKVLRYKLERGFA